MRSPATSRGTSPASFHRRFSSVARFAQRPLPPLRLTCNPGDDADLFTAILALPLPAPPRIGPIGRARPSAFCVAPCPRLLLGGDDMGAMVQARPCAPRIGRRSALRRSPAAARQRMIYSTIYSPPGDGLDRPFPRAWSQVHAMRCVRGRMPACLPACLARMSHSMEWDECRRTSVAIIGPFTGRPAEPAAWPALLRRPRRAVGAAMHGSGGRLRYCSRASISGPPA